MKTIFFEKNILSRVIIFLHRALCAIQYKCLYSICIDDLRRKCQRNVLLFIFIIVNPKCVGTTKENVRGNRIKSNQTVVMVDFSFLSFS